MAEKPYKYIRAWGTLLGSKPGYIEHLIRLARKQNAPLTAIYFSGGKWVTFNDIPSDVTRAKIMDIIVELK